MGAEVGSIQLEIFNGKSHLMCNVPAPKIRFRTHCMTMMENSYPRVVPPSLVNATAVAIFARTRQAYDPAITLTRSRAPLLRQSATARLYYGNYKKLSLDAADQPGVNSATHAVCPTISGLIGRFPRDLFHPIDRPAAPFP